MVVLGGAKVSDKLGVIANLLGKADRLLIGGGMVYTFLAAQGHEVGSSLLEADQVETVKGYLEQSGGDKIVLPPDIVAADSFAADAPHETVPADAIPAGKMGLDIGPKSAALFAETTQGREDDRVERPDGRVRVPGLRRGHEGRRAGPGGRRRLLDRRRRRLGCGRASARLRRGGLRPHLDRAAARASSCSRARPFPASRFWRTDGTALRSWRATGR